MREQSRYGKPLLTPQYDAQFDLELNALHKDWFRAEEFVQGAEWVLVRNPRAGHQLREGSAIWGIAVAADDEIPDCMIFYSFDDKIVRFRSIRTLASLN